jgi:hypothetical protein
MDSSPAIDARQVFKTLELDEASGYQVCHNTARSHALPTTVHKMVRLFGEQRSLLEVCRCAGVPLPKGRAVVRKLIALGVLKIERRSHPSERPSGFTSQEEEFFASEVPPIDECNEPFETLGERVRRLLQWIRS